MTLENKKLTVKYLISAFAESGMPVSQAWIYRQEEKGNLVLPRSTTNFKKARGNRRTGSVRYMTRRQINDILKAFLPVGMPLANGEYAEGTGYYNYKNQPYEGVPTKTV